MREEDFENDRARDLFYRTYHLESLRAGNILIPVRGDSSEIKNKINQMAKRKLKPQDVIEVSLAGESSKVSASDFSSLIISDDLFGDTPTKRADAPVLLVAAKLLDDPNKILKFGPDVIRSLGNRRWHLYQAPAGLDVSAALVEAFADYRAIEQALSASA